MKFCPKCGRLMLPKTEKGKMLFACKCGYSDKKPGKVELKEEVKKQESYSDIAGDDDSHHPITEAECPKCGFKQAYYWLVQTRAGDEPETKFHKCVKCKHTWRDYS